MTTSMEGMAALVTGGGSGIGLACARAMARDGAVVTVCGRTEAKVRAAAEEHGLRWAVCDVTDEASVEAAVAAAAEPLGALHVAVANAGTGHAGPLLTTDLAAWNAVMATNLTGAFLTVKHAGRAISRAGGGSIVAVSSIAGPRTHRFMTPYCVSKAALEMLVQNAADELGIAGIRVNAVRPGLVPTDLSVGLTSSESITADYLDQMPLGRLGTTDDIAEAVRFLAGRDATWITGMCISVDGGHHLRRGPDLTPLMRMALGDDIVEGRL